MHLARTTDFSLRVLMTLAVAPEQKVTSAELASLLAIPREQMMKIVQRLAGAGYLLTLRGKGGGVRLARSPHEIGIGQVVRHIEPGMAIVNCRSPLCPLAGACRLKGVLDGARDHFLAALDGVTLADVASRPRDLPSIPAYA